MCMMITVFFRKGEQHFPLLYYTGDVTNHHISTLIKYRKAPFIAKISIEQGLAWVNIGLFGRDTLTLISHLIFCTLFSKLLSSTAVLHHLLKIEKITKGSWSKSA